MKKITFLLCVSTILFGTLNAQKAPELIEKTYTDLGKVLDFKAIINSEKNLSSNTSENKLVLESKSFTSSEARFIELSKLQVAELITAMNTINSTYFSSTRKTNVEISTTSFSA